MIKLLLRKDDISIHLNGERILDGFNKLGTKINKKELRKFVKSYIDPTGVYDFNRFLRYFAKNVIIDYLSEHISIQMSYYLYNIMWGMHDDYELFCIVYNNLMSPKTINKFKNVLRHLGRSAVYIYQFNTEEDIYKYIEVFESKYVSKYLLNFVESPTDVYGVLRQKYDFETARIEIHRYLNKVYNFTRKV